MSEKIKYYQLYRWGWDCHCGEFNETMDDPSYEESLICEECGKEFTDFEE